MRKLAKRLWEEANPISAGDEVDHYLRNRGLQLLEYPKTLRCHPALGYYEKDASGRSRKVGEYPAMLACIQGADGHAVTLHRTYLKNGKKALGRESKKLLSGGINGAAVRLFEPQQVPRHRRRHRDRAGGTPYQREAGLGSVERGEHGEAVGSRHGP